MGIFTFILIATVVALFYVIPLLVVYFISIFFHIRSNRPYLITTICVNLGITTTLLILQILAFSINPVPQPLFLNTLLHIVVTLVSILGLWKMKKWAIASLLLQVVLGLALPTQQQVPLTLFSFVAFIPLIITLFYFKKFK